MSTANDIKAYLLAESIGTNATIFVNFEPGDPDSVIVLNDSGGTLELGLGTPRLAYQQPTLQVIVRGEPTASNAAVRTTAESIIAKMLEIVTETINGNVYHSADPLQPEAMPLGVDNNKRPRVSCNFLISKD